MNLRPRALLLDREKRATKLVPNDIRVSSLERDWKLRFNIRRMRKKSIEERTKTVLPIEERIEEIEKKKARNQ